MSEHSPYTNRLIKEKSPYLQQHAHNPVNWYPWSQEAFNAAQESDKPIFLSIGYATCHWCHVMENESFENLEIAQLMNENFINIKVDREELPEVDALYMEFAQSMMAGAAGWPLNVVITPELEPFFAATYLPPVNRHGLMGLKDLILRIKEVWQSNEREKVIAQASKIVEIFAENVHTSGDEFPAKEQIEDAAELLFKMADPVHGGMRGTPKFPIGYQWNFMIHCSSSIKDSRGVFLAERTLDMMHRGGIYDHLGGGFHRYSVDEYWLVPHFEKMLYDNALLSYSYLEAWQSTKNPLYRQVCEEIIQYVLRDMTHSKGGFYSAEDADSEGHEGLFYTWTIDEVQEVLGDETSRLFCEFYDVTPEGNFDGRCILNCKTRLEEIALKNNMEPQSLDNLLTEQKHKLWKKRESRVHPFKDDKILSSWNGLMIFSMVEAGCAFGEKRYIGSAEKAARFIRDNLYQSGHLLRRWRDGEALHRAGIDEYTFLIRGLLSLFEADCGVEWLEWAMEMTETLESQFKEQDGAFYQTDGEDPNIILRKCQFSDGAEPSGNAIHCENLLRIYLLTFNPFYLDQAKDVLCGVKKYLDSYPPGYCYHLMNLNRYYDKHAPAIVVALDQKEHYRSELRELIYSKFLPHKAVIWYRQEDEKMLRLIPSLNGKIPVEGKTTLYICYEGVCKEPLNDYDLMAEAIQKL